MKRMKKVLSLALALIMMLSLAGCGQEESNRLEDIKERGVLEVTMEPYWVPNEFIDPTKEGDEQYIGLDVEFAKAIAEKIGVELKIVPLEFTAVQAGIVDGKYDLAISALAYSPTRAESMSLSNVYQASTTGYGFLVREEDVDKYTSVEAAKEAVIVTQSGSLQESLYKAEIGSCKELKLVSSMTDGYLAVSEGKADICITAIESGDLYAEVNGGVATTSFRLNIDPNMNGTVVAAPPGEGSADLIALVNEVIEELTAQNKFEEWEQYYKAYAEKLGVE